ncbi:hypothetical protein QBC34DRAFT_387310 [Podospora aff. communis PSN243]|uniref:Uncharacterized protein n=1 Tax=Podospora aff. communis PSN243 TaxID=3040156 RepID=A0AAV9G4X2_9PEZI|nr:hypothetical protein QBC34DRAFT_387310 [Podospora aff. communis PSN243]
MQLPTLLLFLSALSCGAFAGIVPYCRPGQERAECHMIPYNPCLDPNSLAYFTEPACRRKVLPTAVPDCDGCNWCNGCLVLNGDDKGAANVERPKPDTPVSALKSVNSAAIYKRVPTLATVAVVVESGFAGSASVAAPTATTLRTR